LTFVENSVSVRKTAMKCRICISTLLKKMTQQRVFYWGLKVATPSAAITAVIKHLHLTEQGFNDDFAALVHTSAFLFYTSH